MKPKKLRVPAVVHHRATNQDCVFLRDADGVRRMVYLGLHGSTEAARRYREVLAEHFAGRPVATSARPKPQAASGWPTVGQLCAAYMLWAQSYYVAADGTRSKDLDNIAKAFTELLLLHRDTPTDKFTVRDLENVRRAMTETEFRCRKDRETRKPIPGTGKRRCRGYVNKQVARIKRCFRWGVSQRLAPGAVWHELAALLSLTAGRAGVRESSPVEAIPWAMVKPILEYLPTPLRAVVLLQWHSGMRPGEALAMRGRDLQRGGQGEAWTYRPATHKGTWRGRQRTVVLGPEAQAVLRPLLKADPNAYLVSPRDVMAEHRAKLRENRKTPPTRQTRDRDRAAAERGLDDFHESFNVETYRRALHNACDKADVPRWGPHRLRHAAGTRLVLKKGLEAAKAVLGHSDVKVTQRYAVAADSVLATAAMLELG